MVTAAFDLIELGAGDGTKTAVLSITFLRQGADITYSPIDISQEALDALTTSFTAEFPTLKMETLNGDYFQIFESLRTAPAAKGPAFPSARISAILRRDRPLAFLSPLRDVMNNERPAFYRIRPAKRPARDRRGLRRCAGVTAN